MSEIEEGTDFEIIFARKFGQNRANTEARMKSERIAAMTAKQRAARPKKPPKKQMNIRVSEETRALIYALAQHLNSSVTDTVETAIKALAETLPDFNGGKNGSVRS